MLRSRILLLFFCAALAAPAAHAQYGGAGASQGDAPAGQSAPQEKKKEKKRRRWGRSTAGDEELGWTTPHTIRPRQGKRISRANELLLAEDYDGAEKELKKLRVRNLNPVEEATVYQTRAYIEYGRGDNARAREFFEKTIAVEEGKSPSDKADIRFQIAQLYIADQDWPNVIKNLETWFEVTEKPNGGAYYLLALAHYQNGDLDQALGPAKQAVELTPEPKEPWLQLLLALRLTKKEYEQAVPLLEELVRRFPKKSYWVNLSTVYGALGDFAEALVPLQLAYTQGLLDDGHELRRLAQLLLFLELPYRAAQVLQDGLDQGIIEPDSEVYEMLGNSWIAAREYDKTVAPLEEAAKLAENGDLYVRLAQVHIQREKWSKATEALRAGIEKGSLDKPGDAKLLMGIAFYSQERPKQARRWFTQARSYEESRKEAGIWIQHIDRELAQSQSG